MDHVRLGNRLRSARELAGLSQQSVADKLGLQRTAVTLVESGQRQVSTSELTHFATLYRRSIAELIDPDEKFSEDYLVVLYRLAPELQNDPLVKQDVEVCLELCRLGVDLQNALAAMRAKGLQNSQWSSQRAPAKPCRKVLRLPKKNVVA